MIWKEAKTLGFRQGRNYTPVEPVNCVLPEAHCVELMIFRRLISELKRLFIKIYEDNASGKLSDERFDMMSQTYEAEQKELEAEVIRLQKEIEVQETQIQNIEKFIQKASQYVGIEELTPYVLHELIKAIYVDAPDKSSGKRRQHIHIQYDGLGFIPLNELLPNEKA